MSASISPSQLTKTITPKDKQNSFFEFLRNYLRIQSPGRIVIDKLKTTICETYQDLYQENKVPIYISVSMSEQLLKIAQEKQIFEIKPSGHQIKNLLVALCENPWDVDVAVGGYGVCYHGNMGEPPTFPQAMQVLIRNHREHLMISHFY